MVLEAGCGEGSFIKEISNQVEKIVGVDTSEHLLQKARDNLKGIKNVELLLGDIEDTPLKPNYFDYVISMWTLVNLDNPERFVISLKNLVKREGKIFVDSTPLDEILKKFNTPLYIFLENRIRENINSFINTFNEKFGNIQYFYSFKANYLPEICKIMLSEGIGAKLVSFPELKLAIKTGFSPDKIIIGGPYLPENLIESSIKNKVKEIIVYNLKDLKKINSVAQNYNRVQNVCIRVNSQKYDSKLGIISEKAILVSFKPEILAILIELVVYYLSQLNLI